MTVSQKMLAAIAANEPADWHTALMGECGPIDYPEQALALVTYNRPKLLQQMLMTMGWRLANSLETLATLAARLGHAECYELVRSYGGPADSKDPTSRPRVWEYARHAAAAEEGGFAPLAKAIRQR